MEEKNRYNVLLCDYDCPQGEDAIAIVQCVSTEEAYSLYDEFEKAKDDYYKKCDGIFNQNTDVYGYTLKELSKNHKVIPVYDQISF